MNPSVNCPSNVVVSFRTTTVTFPSVGISGVTAVISCRELVFTSADYPAIKTANGFSKLSPVIVTSVPPEIGPLEGEIAEIIGESTYVIPPGTLYDALSGTASNQKPGLSTTTSAEPRFPFGVRSVTLVEEKVAEMTRALLPPI